MRNAGPMAATGVYLDLAITDTVTPQSFTSSAGACGFESTSLRCDFGDMPSGATATISATVVADRPGTVNADVYVVSDDIDLFGGNDGGRATITVNPIPESTREASALSALNAFRTSQGEPALATNARLGDCARAWAQTMAETGTLAHDSGLQSCAGGATWLGQVVGTGDWEVDIVAAWIDSCSHRDALLHANATHLGVAVAYGHDAEWWVVNLADLSSSSNAVTTLQNACFDDGSITDGVRYDAVRTQGVWHTYHDAGGATTRGSANGDYYLSVRDPNPGVASAAQVVLAQPGKRYRVDGYSKYVSGTPQELHLQFLDASWRLLSSTKASPSQATTAWAGIATGTVTAPSGTAYARVVLYGPSVAGYASTFLWDEIELTRSV